MEKLVRYKLFFYVPTTGLEKVKEALFQTGAGVCGDYEQACWQCLGTGQFKPLPGANPSIGEINQLTTIEEYKVEIICNEKNILDVIKALKASHPYEEPAYDVFRLEDF